jgi:hypothetical protein
MFLFLVGEEIGTCTFELSLERGNRSICQTGVRIRRVLVVLLPGPVLLLWKCEMAATCATPLEDFSGIGVVFGRLAI